MRTGSNAAARRPSAMLAVLALALAGMAVQVLAFAWKAANPVVVSDAWHFLDLVIRPYATGDLGVGDLFVKRSALDHSQPLNKLVSIANYEWFDLDYRVEAVLGALFACASIALLWAMWRRTRAAPGTSAAEAVAMAALAAVYLSLGVSVAYSWPLLAMGFSTHVFVLGVAWLAWRAQSSPGPRAWTVLFAFALLAGVVADDVALMAATAVVVATGIVASRDRRWGAAVATAASVALGLATYLLLYRALAPTPPGRGAGPALAAEALALLQRPGDWWPMLAAPLAASVAHRTVLSGWLGAGAAEPAAAAIAALLLACHGWFWLAALHRRSAMNALAFTAIVLMLLFYGLLLALLLTRVAEYGTDYLWQPRYIVLYRWNLVALLLMLLAQRLPGAPAATPVRAGGNAMLAIGALLLALQVPLALHTWGRLPYLAHYHANEARQVILMAARGGEPPKSCIASLVVCRFPAAKRQRVLHFLEQQRLNVFAPGLREDLGVEPDGD